MAKFAVALSDSDFQLIVEAPNKLQALLLAFPGYFEGKDTEEFESFEDAESWLDYSDVSCVVKEIK